MRQAAVRSFELWHRTAVGRISLVVVLTVAPLTAARPTGTQLHEPRPSRAILSNPRDTTTHRLGPYDILLFPTPAAPQVHGRAWLVFADSPFGVAFTADGHAEYNVRITASNLPAPSTLGKYSVYQAWAVSPDLAHWDLMGLVRNGTVTVGPVDLNKFVVTIVAAADSASTSHDGTAVLHGTSPSGWLQLMFTQPEFHNVNQ